MRQTTVSFEFFPPNDESGAQQLWAAVLRLAPLTPKFVSITYGADGSSQAKTHDAVLRLLRETDLVVAPHLTCIGAPREHVLKLAAEYWRHGVRHLVALRGDAPGVETPGVETPGVATPGVATPGVAATAAAALPRYQPDPAGFAYASDLVHALRRQAAFDISVAAYPEGHPETRTVAADILNLKRKVDAGAGTAITQFFFDTDAFLRYRDQCATAGVRVNLVPGILPITRFPQLLKFAKRCGASVPDWLHARFDGLDQDADTRRMIAAHVAIEQVQRLQRHGVDDFHFYTLNRAELTFAICHALGLRPRVVDQAEVA